MDDDLPPRGGAQTIFGDGGWVPGPAASAAIARPPAYLASNFDAARRLWRVALGWVGVLIVAAIGLAFAWGVLRSAHTGLPMADFSSGILPLLTVLAPLLLEQWNRHVERRAGVA